MLKNYTYFMPSKLLFGAGSLRQLHEQSLPGHKALVVVGGTSVKKYGYLADLEEQLNAASVQHVLYDRIQPNPTKDQVMEAAALAKTEQCDCIIGLGGGSTIDAAKAIAMMATNPGDLWDYFHGGTAKGQPLQAKPLPVVAITTTAGTGTEADPWLVITNTSTNEKIGFGCDATYPTLSIIDWQLMVTVPPALTAYQGFDALFHSVEGYLNQGASPVSDVLALEAIRLVGKYLPTAVSRGNNLAAREQLAVANTLSGIVESLSSCISQHAIEHALSGFHPELPHGAGLIMLSLAYFQHFVQQHCCDERFVTMAKALGKTGATVAEDFIVALQELQVACQVDQLQMSNYGIQQEQLPQYAHKAREIMPGLFAGDPTALSDQDVVAILERAYR